MSYFTLAVTTAEAIVRSNQPAELRRSSHLVDELDGEAALDRRSDLFRQRLVELERDEHLAVARQRRDLDGLRALAGKRHNRKQIREDEAQHYRRRTMIPDRAYFQVSRRS